MIQINRKLNVIALGLSCVLVLGVVGLVHSDALQTSNQKSDAGLVLMIDHPGNSKSLQRPAVAFDHDMHTKSLKSKTNQDCGACHLVKKDNPFGSNQKLDIYLFPKEEFDRSDISKIMVKYHNACGSCHKTMAKEGKKTGPQIGMCGKCHVRTGTIKHAEWNWSPIFNYVEHASHIEKISKNDKIKEFNIAGKVEIRGELREANSNCHLCHHSYDEKTKKLYYTKDTENSCGACHKSKDEKNVRSLRNVVHAACIGCHTKANEGLKKNVQVVSLAGPKDLAPIECKGCHKDRKAPKASEIAQRPRLMRGQKDFMALSYKEPGANNAPAASKARMKSVYFNHKSHEPRAQFCNSCHHHSLEACGNCHTMSGDRKKGGGVSYERAFHTVTSQKACIGCHEGAKSVSKCAGCHSSMPNRWLSESTCAVCHTGQIEGKPTEQPDLPLTFDKERVPEKILIKTLEKEFKPAEFAHAKIVTNLTKVSNQSSLAKAFHATKGENAICAGCHHRTEPSAAQTKKVPACISCHTRSFDPSDLGRPGILAAYHRQCMGCHEAMNQKPLSLECAKCHQPKDNAQQTAKQLLNAARSVSR